MSRPLRFFVALAAASLLFGTAAAAQDLADVELSPSGIFFAGKAHTDGFSLTVRTPEGAFHKFAFAAGETPFFDLGSIAAADGSYKWELQPIAAPRARVEGNSPNLPSKGVQSGSFTVAGGAIVVGGEEAGGAPATPSPLAKTQVIAMDLIVQGSACVGQDCTSSESFGFDTLRLKENNLRIKFQDTSSAGTFPSNDWQLTANDSSNGGANKFSIDDIDGGRTPFTIEAGAPSNSLYVDDGGRVGFGTSTPVVELHVVNGDSPTLRLEQNGSSGFTPQTFDIAANETNFFIRDVTNGSRLPFRSRPGAPTSSIDIAANGDVGIGTSSPSQPLHVRRTDGRAQVFVEEANATQVGRTLVQLTNNGAVAFSMTNQASTWDMTSTNNQFRIDRQGNADIEFLVDNNGNVTIPAGSTYNGSDRNKKSGIAPVDASEILAKVASLPLAEWSWSHEADAYRHLGPMAQDFYATFGLGRDGISIVPMDMAGIALAAIQELNQQLESKAEKVGALEARNAELEARLAALEAAVAAIAGAND